MNSIVGPYFVYVSSVKHRIWPILHAHARTHSHSISRPEIKTRFIYDFSFRSISLKRFNWKIT